MTGFCKNLYGEDLFETVWNMKFIIQTVDLVEATVAIAVANHVIVNAGIIVVCVQAPGPHPIPDYHADNTVT